MTTSKIIELTRQIESHNIAYANGLPYITDSEYDTLWRELHALDPNNPHLFHTTRSMECRFGHVKHKRPIYGLQKAFCTEDLKPFRNRHGAKSWRIEPKYDGVAAIKYTNPNGSDQLVLSGNGHTGADITHHLNAINFKALPDSVVSPCELIIPFANWTESLGANPRNVVAGMVNSHHIDKLNLIEAVPHNDGPHYLIHNPNDLSYKNLEDKLLDLFYSWNEVYPMDGLVIKLSDPDEQLKVSHNGTVNLWSIAWKPPMQTAETTVTDIHWNVSRNGRVIPTIEYKPIDLCGTTNRMVTGNNAKWLLAHEITTGTTIQVGKAGEIIPKIIKIISHGSGNFNLPTGCPFCKHPLIWDGVHLLCDSPKCLSKIIKRVAYFYSDKGMGLKGIGEAMIEQLLLSSEDSKNALTEHPYALLAPTDILSDVLKHVWGAKRYENYLSELDEITNKKNPCHFIAGLGYKNLAYKTCYSLAQKTMGLFVREKHTQKKEELFLEGLLIFNRFVKLTGFKYVPISDKVQTQYCITGELTQHRDDIIAFLSKHNWHYVNNVSKNTEFLILGSLPKESTKLHKARSIGITILSEEELYNFIKKQGD